MIFFPAGFAPLAIRLASFEIVFADICSSAGIMGCNAKQVPSVAVHTIVH
jgi:hypothetical protein